MTRLSLPLFLIPCLFFLAVLPLSVRADTKLPPLEITVTEFEGTVQVTTEGSDEWNQVQLNDELQPGDRIRTGADGRVTLNAPGISVTKLSPNSEIMVEDLTRRTVQRESLLGSRELNVNDVRLEAVGGTVQNAVKDHEDVEINYDITTPDAIAGVRGTVFEVGMSDDGSLVTSVLDGEVLLYNPAFENQGRRIGPRRVARLNRGARSPTSTQPMPESDQQRLDQFREQSSRQLEVPPWLGEFQLNGNGFRKNIKIAYDEARELTLSGVAEAQEEGRELSQINLEGDFGERVITPESTDRRSWSASVQPGPPAEGESKVLNVRLSAEDSDGLRSPVYTLTVTLVHPEERGDRGSGDVRLPVGIELSPELTGDQLIRRDVVQEAIGSLGSIREALVRRDRSGYLNGFQSVSSVRVGGRSLSYEDFRSQLTELFPVLSTPTWTLVIEDVALDGDRIQIVTESSYSARMVELLDVEPGVLDPDPGDVVRRRPIEQLQSNGIERFVFDRSGEQPRLGSANLGLFLNPRTLAEARKQQARWRIKNVLFGLFYAYEQGTVSGVTDRVHEDFLNNDDNGFRHGYADFLDSVRLDLQNLYDLSFSVRVQSIQFEGSLDRARVEINWDRRARLGNTNQLWLSSDNSSVLRFRRSSPYRLARISGDPLMGLSSPRTGATLVRGGSLEDEANFAPQLVSSDGSVDNFDGNEFPELTEEETTEIAGEGCFSGTVDADVTSDVTWCDDVSIPENVEIASGVTVNVDPGTNLTIDGSVSLTVSGQLDMDDVTVSHPSNFKTPGITYSTGSSGTIDNSTFNDADFSIQITGADVTVRNSRFNGAQTDDTDGGALQIRISNGTVTLENNTFTTVENLGSSTAVRFGTGTDLTLTGNTFEGTYQVYVRAEGNFTGSLTSSSNNFNGGGNTTWGVANESSSGGATDGSMSFDNDIFKNLTRGICTICNGGSGKDLTVNNSDFIDNDQPGVAASGSVGTVSLDGNYFGGNNGNNCYTLSENTPDDTSTVNSQYEGATSVSNAQNSPNRAPDPGYTSCGV